MLGVGYWLRKQAFLRGSKTALVEGEKRLSYLSLNQRVNCLTWVLKEKFQLQKGDRVAVLAFNCCEFIELFFATAKLGLILVPLNVRLTVREHKFMLSDSGAKVLFVDGEFSGVLEQLQEICSLEIVMLGEAYEKFLMCSSDAEPALEEKISFQDKHLILYTSGTTGRPKGAVLTHGNAFWNAVNMQIAIGLNKTATTLTVLPLFHTGGIGLYLLPTLHQGGTVIIQRKFSPAESIQLIKKEKIMAFFAVPVIFQTLLEAENFTGEAFSSVRNMMSGGAPLPISLIEKYQEKGLSLLQGCGCTETSPGIFALDEEAALSKAGSVGKPLLHTQVYLSKEDGSEVSPGETGEIRVKGGNVMSGYWQAPEASREAFHAGWFKTGDLAWQDEDGYYFIAGRKKDMIISGGENIYPAEVEGFLAQYSGVREVSVIGIPDERWGEIPVAVVVPEREDFSVKDIVTYCNGGLARYKVPKKVFLLPELPRNAAGKVLKNDLREMMLRKIKTGKN